VAGYREDGSEPSCCVRARSVLDLLSDDQLVKKHAAPRCESQSSLANIPTVQRGQRVCKYCFRTLIVRTAYLDPAVCFGLIACLQHPK
jgi:hypothetical protein